MCGWVPPEDWKECRDKRVVPGADMVPSVCPGYSITLPQVHQAAQAWGWWSKGQLAMRFPEPTDVLLDLIDIFNGGVNGAEAYEHKQAMKDHK